MPSRSWIGTTERAKRPSAQAVAARCWLATAYASRSRREYPWSVATRSALMPCGTK